MTTIFTVDAVINIPVRLVNLKRIPMLMSGDEWITDDGWIWSAPKYLLTGQPNAKDNGVYMVAYRIRTGL